MSDDMDWLSELVPASGDEAVEENVPETVPAVGPGEEVVSEAPVDLLSDLRGEMVTAGEEAAAVSEEPRPRRTLGGLLPWQIFFLSVLFFLDIVVIGLLFLVMLGRIVIPF